MGVDVQIGIKGAEWLPDHPLAERVIELLGYRDGKNPPLYLREDDGWLEIGSLNRYYGPGYERGNWPVIYGALRALQEMYPGHQITYGGDGGDAAHSPDVTPEYLDEIWQHWLGPDGDAYHQRP